MFWPAMHHNSMLTISFPHLRLVTFIVSGVTTKFSICIIVNENWQVAFDKIGSMTTNTISKQRKKQEPAVMAELDQRLRRLNSLKMDDK